MSGDTGLIRTIALLSGCCYQDAFGWGENMDAVDVDAIEVLVSGDE
ncbi:hypothetical protein [Bifidobacterium dentium]|nr:hypothetical protein [Bifidobacterium dentium]